MTNFIHPKAQLGNNVKVEHFASIYEDVIIGEETWIGPNVTIFPGTRIGSHCKIFPGAVIGAIPQDLKFNGEYSTVEIGNHVSIRECSTINRGTSTSGTTKIGNHSLLMAYVHIAHDCVIGEHCILANSTNLAGHVIIEDYAYFGGMSGAHQFTKIGKHSFISGGSMIGKDVPPFCLVMRNPAQFAGINSVGLKRHHFSKEDIHTIQDIYRFIFGNNGLNTTQALTKIEEEIPNSELRNYITQFIYSSERGIIKGVD
ncbi:MAG TPA: acyl-ACP--UDP-N-acetylglucosamine O-acyltransferase [Chitinophagales bacterium]|nr:acyl-ACP--UDP-N-acetylglucosamine O-acyltransferase [Chitinophagales bacterium]MBP6153683.1 acyl-ACP--UDP-N-acetylglucosamine O-acyltransferase [Chitinophagales bacterium]HQV79069.1 acyl-ACP--UDP-N-acetylglucosamine O-acyltransferase [Chitinophagales bacterium]HQW79808.1 acyl-ACP--UDP-N-acetylglucosamine O-acyltransferase [Chitinophagales bacterium]HRB67750.1 acyl-ACP--UDP-N-acetylglucosamine O-acyltransferase [Chitinophagales bacterium]